MGQAARRTNFIVKGASAAFGLLLGTRVYTLDGVLPVEFLAPGDSIICRQGSRKLMGLTVARPDRAELVRIRASTLGHNRPERDLLVAPSQPVVIRDWRARALYAVPVAAVPAQRLVDDEFILTETCANPSLFTLHFAEDEVIYAEGLELACPLAVRELLGQTGPVSRITPT